MKKQVLSLVLALGLAGGALAQNPPGGTGPDVIVGSIPNISNYSTQGGVDAFSIGTTSCNIGTANLLWVANTNEHPVIGQHAFRLHDGRFEMIGQSWLKHGFTALSGSVCESCTGGGGSVLGVGCSDPYGSGLNGSQSGLGPKWQVNAFTGVFSYPFAPGNGNSDSVYKRLQIATADLNAATYPGAKYFVEAQYVTQDDAAAGNGENNASYREVTFSGSGEYAMSFASGSSTQRGKPAILAWQVEDPDVVIEHVHVPGEGLFIVGYKGSAIGGGLFQYELAVHNLNSHRSAKGFTVTVPSGANVSNIGFHDVDYHSGEPFDGTDWSASVVGNQVTWTTTDFAVNPNANALRWGTLYNFRFVSDVDPGLLGVPFSIELFRPGTPTSVGGSFGPESVVQVLAGDDQVVNGGEALAPLQVLVTDPNGSPIVNESVVFTRLSGPAVTFANGGQATTDANGIATMTGTAGNGGGALLVRATVDNETADFDVFVRAFNVIWVDGPGVLVVSAITESPFMPITLAMDDPAVTPLPTVFGTVCTSILSPGPLFYAESGDPFAGVAYRPELTTGANGTMTKVYTGLGVLSGSGISRNFQAYGAHFPNGVFSIYVSACDNVTFTF